MAMVEMRGNWTSQDAPLLFFIPESPPSDFSPHNPRLPEAPPPSQTIVRLRNGIIRDEIALYFPCLVYIGQGMWYVHLPPFSALFTAPSPCPSMCHAIHRHNYYFFSPSCPTNQSMRDPLIWLARCTNPNSAAEWSFRWPTLRIKQLWSASVFFDLIWICSPDWCQHRTYIYTNKQTHPWALQRLNWLRHNTDKRINGKRDNKRQRERERVDQLWRRKNYNGQGKGKKANQMQASNKQRIHRHTQRRHR